MSPMIKTDAEKKFEQYRESLHQEITNMACYIRLYTRLHERGADRLDEMNIAPAFFQIVINALLTAIVLWVDKLFGERSERGLMHFLSFVENNRELLDIKELQRRNNYPADHWFLRDRKAITLKTIQDDRERLRQIGSLPSFRLRRNTFLAHFDKEYFFDREKLYKDAPILWSDLEEVLKLAKEVLNNYSVDYDGREFDIEPWNVTDVDMVLDILHRHRKQRLNGDEKA